jgi:hypothetical protein
MLPEDQQARLYQQEQERIAKLTKGTLVEVYRGGHWKNAYENLRHTS